MLVKILHHFSHEQEAPMRKRDVRLQFFILEVPHLENAGVAEGDRSDGVVNAICR